METVTQTATPVEAYTLYQKTQKVGDKKIKRMYVRLAEGKVYELKLTEDGYKDFLIQNVALPCRVDFIDYFIKNRSYTNKQGELVKTKVIVASKINVHDHFDFVQEKIEDLL